MFRSVGGTPNYGTRQQWTAGLFYNTLGTLLQNSPAEKGIGRHKPLDCRSTGEIRSVGERSQAGQGVSETKGESVLTERAQCQGVRARVREAFSVI